MTAGGACPRCAGLLAVLAGTRWLRCGGCCTSFDGRGHAYGRDWLPVREWDQP